MSETKQDKWTIIDKIIEFEKYMFDHINAREKSNCQEQPKTFKLMRWMTHSVLPIETLTSYLEDLEEGKKEGRNFMTEKYARMENLIPPLQENPIIFQIAEVELEWMKDLKTRYPNVISGEPDNFRQYLCCELETYSDKTLELLIKDIRSALVRNLNLAELRYKNLFKRLGYNSLDEVEEKQTKEA